jgi:type II secretory pathway pseudopilin PulG
MTNCKPTMMKHRRCCGHFVPQRSGFTLLEVLLSLGLSIVVVTVIGYAIFFHMRVLDSQRARVEQALVARGMLNLIAGDVRAAVQYKPVDVSQLEALLASVDLETLLGSAAGEELLNSALNESGVDPATVLGGETEEGIEEGTEESTEIPLAGDEGPRPGLYGSSTELQIDISRMPRRDQYLYGLQTTANDYPSDLRSISYRLVPTETLDPNLVKGVRMQDPNASLGTQGGTGLSLVRSTISQAVRRFEQNTGNGAEIFGETEVLADEVASLQFRYFDGSQGAWLAEWDTDEMESLPTAVEITIEFQFSAAGIQDSTALLDQAVIDSYRLIVHLPLAEPPEDESDETTGVTRYESPAEFILDRNPTDFRLFEETLRWS